MRHATGFRRESLKKIKIEGPDAIGFAKRLGEIAGEENLQIKTKVVLKCKHGAKLSYEQIEGILDGEQYRVKIKKTK